MKRTAIIAAVLAVIFGALCIVGIAGESASQATSIAFAALLGVCTIAAIVTFVSSAGAKNSS